MPAVFHRPVDRREFLQTTVLAGAVLALAPRRLLGAAQPETEFHLALLSDTHVPGDRLNGHRGFNPWTNLQQVVPEVITAGPQAVAINGDAARLEGLPADYQELRALLEPLAAKAPIYIGLGNHDDRANFLQAFPQLPGQRAPVPNHVVTVVEHEVVRLVLLDSLLYVNRVAGLLGLDQRRWLAENLGRLNDRPLVLMVHHTLGDGDGDLLDADRLFALLRPHRHVKAIFYGHSHVWEIGEREGVRLINLPALGYNFRDQDPVGWVDAKFRRDGAELTLRAIAGNRSDDGKSTWVKWG